MTSRISTPTLPGAKPAANDFGAAAGDKAMAHNHEPLRLNVVSRSSLTASLEFTDRGNSLLL